MQPRCRDSLQPAVKEGFATLPRAEKDAWRNRIMFILSEVRTQEKMSIPTKNTKALIYCSVWPDEGQDRTLASQSVDLQTYCVMQGLEVVDIVTDVGPGAKGRLRSGLERILTRTMQEGIGHIIVQDVGRIGRGSREVLGFLRDTFDSNRTEIHVTAW